MVAKACNYVWERTRLRRERDLGLSLESLNSISVCLAARARHLSCAHVCERACVRALQLNHLYGRIGTTYYNTLKYGQIGTTRVGWTRMWVASLWVRYIRVAHISSRSYITNLGRFRLLDIRVPHTLVSSLIYPSRSYPSRSYLLAHTDHISELTHIRVTYRGVAIERYCSPVLLCCVMLWDYARLCNVIQRCVIMQDYTMLHNAKFVWLHKITESRGVPWLIMLCDYTG